MRRARKLALVLLALAPLFPSAAPASSLETLRLRSHYEPGDRYMLSLNQVARTEASSFALAAKRRRFFEEVELVYRARVTVLEVDEEGRPLRERHDRVSLVSTRGNERKSLFGEGTAYEVRRRPRGGARIYVQGDRIARRIERVVSDLLDTQFEHSAAPALFDPGRPVAVNESWSLDRSLARRFLRQQGLRALDFGERMKATLRRRDGRLVIVFHIPVEWVSVKELPASALTSKSFAYLEGQVRLPGESGIGPATFTSNLDLRLDGRLGSSSASLTAWSIRSRRSSDQRTRLLRSEPFGSGGLAAAFGPRRRGPASDR